jgi:hypothetical protein
MGRSEFGRHRKRPTSRPFPYEQVGKMLGAGENDPEIAKAIDRVGKADDPYHSIRVALTRMHKGQRQVRQDREAAPSDESHCGGGVRQSG